MACVPRQVEDPVEIRAHHGVLGAADLHRAQALELLLGDSVGFARQIGLGDPLLEPVQISLIALVFAELLLDGLELLPQHVFALVLAHLLLDLGVDALAHLEDLELSGEQAEHLADAFLDIHRLHELGFLLHRRVQVGRHQIRQVPRRLDGIDERAGLARQFRHQLDDLLGDVAEAHGQSLGLHVFAGGAFDPRHPGAQVGRGLQHAVEADAG